MQSSSFLNIIIPFFCAHCAVVQKVSGPILQRKFSVVIEATYTLCPQIHHQMQIFIHARFLLMAQTCDNLRGLSSDYMGGVGEDQISAI